MRKLIYPLFLIILAYFIFPDRTISETELNFYLNDFYSKSSHASQILEDIEINLKEGSRKKICSRQREAAKLGLLANKSLIKAFEINGAEAPVEAIKASQRRWEFLLKKC